MRLSLLNMQSLQEIVVKKGGHLPGEKNPKNQKQIRPCWLPLQEALQQELVLCNLK